MTDSIIKKAYDKITSAIRTCFRRFPATVSFVLALTCLLCYYVAVEGEFPDKKLFIITIYYLSVGALLSLSLHLWSEEVKNKTRKVVVHTVANVLLLADSIMLYYLQTDKYNIEIGIAHGAAIFSLWLSLFFLSFFKEKDDIPSWNFAIRGFKSFIIANILGGVMCSGISLLVVSLNRLFGIEIPYESYRYVSIFCNLLLVIMLFIGFLPQGEAKHDNRPLPGNILTFALRYLFLPLTAGYMAVLYIYGAKILVTWELPTGWVSWLVTLLMLGCLIVEFCIYPVRKAKAGKWDEKIARWLPILILPLLLLMTVGIIRRFSDYGITINRLYIITFNIWCYMVCVVLFVTRAKRISWIPISFAAVFLITSVFPVNYTSITRNILHSDIEKAFTQNGQNTLPLTKEQYGQWCAATPDKEVAATTEKMDYMEQSFGRKSISDLVKDDVNFEYAITGFWHSQDEDRFFYGRVLPGTSIKVPEGYGEFIGVDKYIGNINVETGSDIIPIPISEIIEESSSDTLEIAVQQINKLAEDEKNGKYEMQPVKAHSNTKQHCIIITAIGIKKSPGGEITINTIEGYLFKKQP